MLKAVVLILIALQCLTLIQMRARRIQVNIHSYNCKIFTDRMKRFDCDFKKLALNLYAFNQYMVFSRNLDKEFQVRFWLQIQTQNAKKSTSFLDTKLKVCESLTKPFEGQLLSLLLDDLKQSSNLPRSCPFKANFPYKINNLTVGEEYFPPYAPILNFTYVFELYDNKVVFASTTVVGALDSRKK